jgi:hypothetical protein
MANKIKAKAIKLESEILMRYLSITDRSAARRYAYSHLFVQGKDRPLKSKLSI